MGRSHGSSSDATDQAIGGMESDDVIFLLPAWITWNHGRAGTILVPGTEYYGLMENPQNCGKSIWLGTNEKGFYLSVVWNPLFSGYRV